MRGSYDVDETALLASGAYAKELMTARQTPELRCSRKRAAVVLSVNRAGVAW